MKSGVLCHSSSAQCSCARVMRWKAKVTSSLTDVWQRLFEQQDITVIVLCTIHSHPWLHENHTRPVHQSMETPTETDTQEHVYQKPVRDVDELKQHVIETWSATSRASLIKRLISGKIVLMCVCFIPKSKH